MPFFQNPFESEFNTNLYGVGFKLRANRNTSVDMMTGTYGPYNLTGNTNLTINYSLNSGHNFFSVTVNVAAGAASVAAVTPAEIQTNLQADATVAGLFTVETPTDGQNRKWVRLRARRSRTEFKAYITNGSAESILLFNKNAAVGELPNYCDRHTVANMATYSDSMGMLVKLNTASATDQAIITAAGLDYSTVKEDYTLLAGRSDLFIFKKQTVDGSNRVTQIIEYPAGSRAGDAAKLTTYTYSGANTTPSTITEEPYVLQSGDILTP